jgi:ligand-binding sensor domain-containing protein
MLRTLIFCVALFCIFIPVSGTVMTFIPATGSISSLEVMDISESHDGMVAFATTNGLSLYDSGWATIQKEPWNYDTGLQDDFIQTIEFDDKNYLWLGFSAGVQKYDGISFTRVGKDEFFSTMNIHDILCDNNTIWIANGYSGLNHYLKEDGTGSVHSLKMGRVPIILPLWQRIMQQETLF